MSNLNSVSLVGRLCADVEVKKSAKGIPFTQVNLAVDDFNGKDKICYFFQVNVVGKSAEALADFCHKGDMIGVSGKLTQRTVEKDKIKHSYTSVLANNIQFLSSKKEPAKPAADPKKKESGKIDPPDDIPF